MNKNKIILISLIGLVLIGSLLLNFYINNKQVNDTDLPNASENTIQETAGDSKYKGTILAGNTTPYIDFNPEDFALAHAEGKFILLNFYANWCPICRAEAPKFIAGIEAVDNPNVVAFRVNFKDSDTDDLEEEIADEYSIPYQHTKLLLSPEGEVLLKETKAWDTEETISKLQNLQ